MAGSVNKVILVGNVGKEPEIRTTQSGSRIANMSIATSESWKDKQTGETRQNTQWHRVVIFNDALVNLVERFVTKGTKLFLEGQLETRKWTDSHGKDQYATEVVLRPYRGELTLLTSRNDAQQQGQGSGDRYASSRQAQQPAQYDSNAGGFDDLDDDIPF